MPKKLAVIAIGGNSLIRGRDKQSVEDQYDALCETISHVADIIEAGWQVLVTHGNGPQVGFIMFRSEIAHTVTGMHAVPLAICGADTQGSIGFQIVQALGNELRKRNIPSDHVTAIVTQTRVDAYDPANLDPSKFVGEPYDVQQLLELRKHHPDWVLKQDSNRGWRRVVPSPAPLEIVEMPAIKALLAAGFHVAACGGGGIPVIDTPEGRQSFDAVIDKDLASSMLAQQLNADMLLISTAVPHVCLNYGTPDETPLTDVSAEALAVYFDAGHFPPGSMGPKIRAALDFVQNTGKQAIITCPQNMHNALHHGTGTRIHA